MIPLRLFVGVLLAASLLVACGSSTGSQPEEAGRPLVVASFYPLQFASEQVGGSSISVRTLTPEGAEPHDVELTSGAIRLLADADLIVYLGEGFQPALEDARAGLDPAKQFDALTGRNLLEGDDAEAGADPHVWLDPTLLASIGNEIADRLSEIVPADAESFSDNAARLEAELEKLDEEFARGLQQCESREIVTSHAAFGYLASRYGLRLVPISGIDPEAEPSPARLAEVARYVEDHHITTIFFEELAPRDLAETLARETGARTDVLSPLESAPDRGDYLDEMRANLHRLRSALACD